VRRGRLFVISSPSGGGKTTVIKSLLNDDPELVYSISMTTRAPRDGEIDGKDYYFTGTEEFRRGIETGRFLEWAVVHGDYYGTPREQIEKMLEEGRKILLDIDVQGGRSVKASLPDSILIFLLPPSLDVLRRRLEARGTESEERLKRRLQTASEEITESEVYDHRIINDTLDETIESVRTIIYGSDKKTEEKRRA